MYHSKLRIALDFLVPLLGAAAFAQVTQRVSLSSAGAEGNGFSAHPSVSADGRFVVFYSDANNLVPGDSNWNRDVFLRDRRTGRTECVSVDSNGAPANNASFYAWNTPDARYITFSSLASNVVPGDTNDSFDVFVLDRQTGATQRVSVDSGGAQANFTSFGGSITPDGRFVTFHSFATNLVPGDTNGAIDVYLHDRLTGATERLSLDSHGVQANGWSWNYAGSVSDDGRYVAFESDADNLVAGDTNQRRDAFVRDRQLGITERVDVATSGSEGDGDVFNVRLSADGRFAAFSSQSTNLIPGDTNGMQDIFVRDRQQGITERVNVSSGGVQANGSSSYASISADGRSVVFQSAASNLVANDSNESYDIFLHDRQTGTTELVSVTSGGEQTVHLSQLASLSTDGRFVVFETSSPNLVPGDTNADRDVFVRDRFGGPTFTSLCDPGNGSVLACPCSNSPASPGRGCDNSSGTGGAILTASGGTFLSSDTLQFRATRQKPDALSIVIQGTASNPSGAIFGQGVRCTSGTQKRLYTRSAVGGNITAPTFGAGDPQVSVRSASLGDDILAGQSRWYLVYYRDSTVLGGCPATSTFNATQTGQVSWIP